MGNGKAEGALSLGRLIEGFILSLRAENKSPKTIEYYGGNLRRFLWFAHQRGWPRRASSVDSWRVREFLAYVGSEEKRWGVSGNGSESSARRASPTTVHHYFVVLRAFFNWASREGLLVASPLVNVKVRGPSRPIIQTFSRQDIENLLEVCDVDYDSGATLLGSRNRAIVLVLLDTGVRASELIQVSLPDVDADRGWIKVAGKGAKERVVRIGSTAQKAVWKYLMHRQESAREHLWLTEEGKPLQVRGLQSFLDRMRTRAGITNARCSPHTFRHTFAVSYLRNGGNVFELQYLLGHSTLEMVKRYVSTLGMMDALASHSKYGPVDNLELR